ncbi:unnamed protein product, partial [Amoebophrya sp. A120]|eukprot:GSA120T00009260001.1
MYGMASAPTFVEQTVFETRNSSESRSRIPLFVLAVTAIAPLIWVGRAILLPGIARTCLRFREDSGATTAVAAARASTSREKPARISQYQRVVCRWLQDTQPQLPVRSPTSFAVEEQRKSVNPASRSTSARSFVLFDLEYNGGFSKERSDSSMLVIQIGAVKVAPVGDLSHDNPKPTLKIVDSFSELIQLPKRPSSEGAPLDSTPDAERQRTRIRLAPHLPKLTGITEEALATDGLSFEEAIVKFKHFCTGSFSSATTGQSDKDLHFYLPLYQYGADVHLLRYNWIFFLLRSVGNGDRGKISSKEKIAVTKWLFPALTKHDVGTTTSVQTTSRTRSTPGYERYRPFLEAFLEIASQQKEQTENIRSKLATLDVAGFASFFEGSVMKMVDEDLNSRFRNLRPIIAELALKNRVTEIIAPPSSSATELEPELHKHNPISKKKYTAGSVYKALGVSETRFNATLQEVISMKQGASFRKQIHDGCYDSVSLFLALDRLWDLNKNSCRADEHNANVNTTISDGIVGSKDKNGRFGQEQRR